VAKIGPVDFEIVVSVGIVKNKQETAAELIAERMARLAACSSRVG